MINSFTRVWQKFIVFVGMCVCSENSYKSGNLFWRRVWKTFKSKVKSEQGGIDKISGVLGLWERSSCIFFYQMHGTENEYVIW